MNNGWHATQPASPSSRFTPFYNPDLSYEDNYAHGPFGVFASPEPPQPPQAAAAPQPQQSFLGHPVTLPFGIPAGPLLNGRFVKAALDHGFDLPVYKTVRTRPWASHPWPNVLAVHAPGDLHPTSNRLHAHTDYRAESLSITNSFGVPSMDPSVWQPDLADAVRHAHPGQLVIGSFQGTQPETGGAAAYIADFALAARLMRETGVRATEVNLSCPNEGTAHLLCFDPGRATAVIHAVKAGLGPVKLIAKIAFFAEDAPLRQLLAGIGPLVDAIAAINTVPAEVITATGEQALPGEGRLRSGVCGSGIRWAGLAMVDRLAHLRAELGLHFAIIGVGGVSSPADFLAYRHAGADAVMSATAAMWNPHLAQQITSQTLNSQPPIPNPRSPMPDNPPPGITGPQQEIADALLDIGAVGFCPANPITFKSGILSPVYCDNRIFPFHPAAWTQVIAAFAALIDREALTFEIIGGIEAAGIPHSAALGYATQRPSVFIRKQAKEHGKRARIEGGNVTGHRVLLVEDLVTTGSSSLSGVAALRDAGAIVTDCLAIVSYGFPEAVQAFAEARVCLHTLTDFHAVLARALARGVLNRGEAGTVRTWMADPRAWKPSA